MPLGLQAFSPAFQPPTLLRNNVLELLGVERRQRFRSDIAQGDQLRQATKDLLLVAAQDEHAVAGTGRPELSFNDNARALRRLAEARCAGGAFLDRASALVGETDQTDVTSHINFFLLLW